MRNFVKFAAVGVAGYLVGFYEMKYKVMKSLTTVIAEKIEREKQKESDE